MSASGITRHCSLTLAAACPKAGIDSVNIMMSRSLNMPTEPIACVLHYWKPEDKSIKYRWLQRELSRGRRI